LIKSHGASGGYFVEKPRLKEIMRHGKEPNQEKMKVPKRKGQK
jgi:predicted RNase H-like HicB family nuclease